MSAHHISLPCKPVNRELRLRASTKERYVAIIHHLATGLTLNQTADALKKSRNIVKVNCGRMRDYFGAQTTVEAVLMARREWNLDI